MRGSPRYVDDGHVELALAHRLERLGDVSGLGADLHVRLDVDQARETFPQHGVVVHQEDPDLAPR